MNSLLPNMRLLGLSSDLLGEDWYERSLEIDERLGDWQMELAEECVYLIYSKAPGAVMHGEGECLIARSVTGPKKTPPSPFYLQDWASAPVHEKVIMSRAWPLVHEEAFGVWQDLQREGRDLTSGFTLCLKRSLNPHFHLEIQVIFKE